MPHYENGTEVKVGDKVSVEFEVTSIGISEDFCNAVLFIKHEGPHKVGVTLSLNTKQLILVIPPDAK